MGLNAGSLSLGDLPTETQSLKTIWLDAPVMSLVCLFMSLMRLFVCVCESQRLLIHVKTSQQFKIQGGGRAESFWSRFEDKKKNLLTNI